MTIIQYVTGKGPRWPLPCCSQGMQSSRGFTLLELLVAMGLIAILSAMAIPTIQESSVRNTVWTATEMIGVQVRQARLKAITRNMSFRVDFDCPAARQMRVLRVTGDAAIDNAANRCTHRFLEHGRSRTVRIHD